MAHDANQNFLHSNYDSGLDHESPITSHFQSPPRLSGESDSFEQIRVGTLVRSHHASLACPAVAWREGGSLVIALPTSYFLSTVTRRNVAGMDVASWLLFWLLNSSSSSFCSSAARPF